MKKHVIIVAGGRGTRMNAETPKQFALLAGKPVLMHTAARFQSAGKETALILVLPANEIQTWKNLCEQYRFTIPHQVAAGGESRFHSVKNGLALVKEPGLVAVHDGVRPIVSLSLIARCFDEAEKHGTAVPFIPVPESMRKISNGKNEAADRNAFVLIQTPQCFSSDILKKAYELPYRESFTDDASVVEASGIPVHLTEGERQNIKITFPDDLKLAESLLSE